MGDWDYGRANGLWGDDGIPYATKNEKCYSKSSSTKSTRSSRHSTKSKNKSYNRSEQLAYDSGFKAYYDESSYNGRCFMKDGKKWIHNIDSLKYQLGTNSDYRIKKLNYDVDAYYKYH